MHHEQSAATVDERRDFAHARELRDLRAQSVDDLQRLQVGEPDWSIDLCRENGDVLASLAVWDRGAGSPLLVQQPTRPALAFELSIFLSDYLRRLWQ